jgi:hypothetical protein
MRDAENVVFQYTARIGAIVKTKQVLAALLIVIGLVSLLVGGFSWTHKEKVLDLGPIEATKTERETIPMPPIVGGLLLASGVVLLLVPSRARA